MRTIEPTAEATIDQPEQLLVGDESHIARLRAQIATSERARSQHGTVLDIELDR